MKKEDKLSCISRIWIAIKMLFISLFRKRFSDEFYLKIQYQHKTGYRINLENPQTFNEKLQWLKLHYREDKLTTMVDKYAVKEYIAEKIGEKYLIPTIGVWENAEDIDFSKLPDRFVLKCTHDSGGLVVCNDKSQLNYTKTKKWLNRRLKRNFYEYKKEWPYKNVKARIIAEEFMEDDSVINANGLTDYKFFCFNGVVDCVMACIDRGINDTKFYFFDENWNLLKLNKRGIEAPAGFTLHKPGCIKEMFEIASVLSKGIPFARVDLYCIKEQPYFGEITFYPKSGYDANLLEETDNYLGEKIDLSIVKM